MLYENVYIDAYGYEIPENILKTANLENQLSPVYDKLNLAPGRLEMMTGLKERRFWDDGTRPSEVATKAAIKAIEMSPFRVDEIGALVNCSVCRDYLEPSTATVIAKNLGISGQSILFDVSNACLGFATGLGVAANMVELGQVESALVVSAEAASEVVENTIKALLQTPSEQLLLASIPSLTLGSAAVAFVLTSKKNSRRKLKFRGGVTLNDSDGSNLCLWGPDTGFPSQASHTMMTDGKTLLEKGTVLARKTWEKFSAKTGINVDSVDTVFSHQVGMLHRNVVFDAIGMDVKKDFTTFEYLGNTGSVAMPITTAMGCEKGAFSPGKQAVMMGIGSGLVCTMYNLEWESA